MSHYHALQIQDFLRAIIEDRPPLVTGEDGRRVVVFSRPSMSRTVRVGQSGSGRNAKKARSPGHDPLPDDRPSGDA